MTEKIQTALQKNDYCCVMQPIFSRDGSIAKYESLIRLNISENEKLLPEDFFHEAEKSQNFKDILLFSTRHAIELLRENPDVHIAINISYKDIEVRQQEIKEDLEEKVYVERELEFTQEHIISKEEHIQRLYMFIETIAVNFREEKYEEVDKLFRKINL